MTTRTDDGGDAVGDGVAAATVASAAIPTKLICSYGVVTPRDLRRTGAETEAALVELRTVIGDVVRVR
jgi:hypothetical protein